MQLFVAAKNLANLDYLTLSDPICTLKVKEANNQYAVERKVGETEVIDNNLNPNWTKHFTVMYQFNRDRELLFQVWNYNNATSRDLIGEAFLKLTDIMMAENQTVEIDLRHKSKPGSSRGLLKIFADSVNATEDVIKFQICASLKTKKVLCFGTDNPYLLIERARVNNHKDYVRVLQTQYKFNCKEPWWDAH